MMPWVAIAAAVLLMGVTLRMWLEFGRRQRQLAAEIHRLKGVVETNIDRTASIKVRIEELEKETNILISRRENLHAEVLQAREKLTELEERLERVKPASRRVDNESKDQKEDWL